MLALKKYAMWFEFNDLQPKTKEFYMYCKLIYPTYVYRNTAEMQSDSRWKTSYCHVFFLFQGIENCEKSLLQPGKMDQLNLELTLSIILLIMISSKELP